MREQKSGEGRRRAGCTLQGLQNGSDVRGVACEGVAGEEVNLTPLEANRIAQGFVRYLSKKMHKSIQSLVIGVGRDARITSEALALAAVEGIEAAGVSSAETAGAKARYCGLATTPAMFMSTVFSETNYDGAVMITASHLPFNRNGMKFFDKDGGLEHEEITEILKIADGIEGSCIEGDSRHEEQCTAHFDRLNEPSGEPASEVMSLYAKHLRGKIAASLGAEDGEKCLEGLHIIVDAGNGDAGFFVHDVLEPLGADTSGSQFLEPDGMFPNHIPNPENKDAMAAIKKATAESNADLGLIFDTDVDRMSCVLSDGTAAARDAIIALMAAILAPAYPGGTIVTDSVVSDRLTQFIEGKLGMHHLRYMRGYKNVIDKCKELNSAGVESPLAMETSGHGALKENYYLDDGAYLAVKLIAALSKAKKAAGVSDAEAVRCKRQFGRHEETSSKKTGRSLSDLIADLPPPGEECEVRFKIKTTGVSDAETVRCKRQFGRHKETSSKKEKDFRAYGKQVLQEFEARAKAAGYDLPPSHEGVRISFHGEADKADGATGWALLRLSLHDPVMPLNIEGMSKGGKDRIMKAVLELLKGFDALE